MIELRYFVDEYDCYGDGMITRKIAPAVLQYRTMTNPLEYDLHPIIWSAWVDVPTVYGDRDKGGVMDILYCLDCGEECEIVEETFDYAGTHCNHGQSGTHHTGQYVSKCCLAEFTDYSEVDNEQQTRRL